MRRKSGVLVMFVRAPQLGRVKSRLARSIGRVAALRAYRDMTATVLFEVGKDSRWQTVLAVTPDRWASRGRFWRRSIDRMPQRHGDLGARMARALAGFPGRPVVIIGSDIPGIRRDHIDQAFRALGRNDMVFGPANDGGYWLVGARPGLPIRNVFDDVRWSSPHALADTLANLASRRRVEFLEQLEDVDEAADLERWRRAQMR